MSPPVPTEKGPQTSNLSILGTRCKDCFPHSQPQLPASPPNHSHEPPMSSCRTRGPSLLLPQSLPPTALLCSPAPVTGGEQTPPVNRVHPIQGQTSVLGHPVTPGGNASSPTWRGADKNRLSMKSPQDLSTSCVLGLPMQCMHVIINKVIIYVIFPQAFLPFLKPRKTKGTKQSVPVGAHTLDRQRDAYVRETGDQ